MKHFLAFIIALFAYTANAQTGSIVTGRVTDDAGNAIERATVTMTRLDDGTKLAPVITGNDGTFMIDSISEGRYTLGITCVGYDKYNKKLRVSGPLDLGAVVMGGSAKMLDEVTVTMRQPQKDLSKIARFVPCVNWYEELTGTLSISEITEIPAAKVYDGRLTLIYIPSTDRRPQMVGIGRFSPTFTSAPGEKSTFKAIQESIYAAFVHPRAYMNKKVRIYYDGESSDRQKTYSIVRPYLRGADNRQIRLYIDPATQFVRRASVFILNPNGSSLEIDANYALSTSRQQYYPEQVHAVITDSTQRTYEVTISGMTLNTGNVKKYRKFQNDMLKTRQLPSIY